MLLRGKSEVDCCSKPPQVKQALTITMTGGGIDSYRYLDFASRKIMKAWAARDARVVRSIPWHPMSKPLSESTVALVTTAGVARNDDVPFDQEGERRNPWWGDPSYRVVPRGLTEADVRFYHMHIDARLGEKDLDVFLPMRRLDELVRQGVVGQAAESHYSIMGYQLRTGVLESETSPSILDDMKKENVDAAALIPA